RYEVNNHYVPRLEAAGMVISSRSVDQKLVEMIELPYHPWFIACQFHPEFTSNPRRGHPLFTGFINAAIDYQQEITIRIETMQLNHFKVGLDQPLFLIAGPCVVESEDMVMDIAGYLKEITDQLKIPFIFKASFDKANRSSQQSFRGLGMEKALA